MFKKFFLFLFMLSLFSVNTFASKTHYVNTPVLKVRLAPSIQGAHSYNIYKGHRVKVFELKDGWARLSRYKRSVVDGKFAKRAHWSYAKFLTKLVKETQKTQYIEKAIAQIEAVDDSNTHFVDAWKLKVRTGSSTTSPHIFNLNRNKKVKVYEFYNGWARISEYKNKSAQWVFAKYLKEIPKEKHSINNLVQEDSIELIKTKVMQEKSSINEEAENKIFQSLQTQNINKNNTKVDAKLLKVIESSDKFNTYKEVFTATSQRLYDEGVCRIRDFKRTKGWIEISDNVLFFIYCGKIKRSNKIYLNVITGEATK